jgi:capsule polysaccharide export protein KpsE/RkpR
MFSHFKQDDIRCIEEKLCFLITQGETILTAISDFAAQQATYNAQMDASIADIQTEVAALQAEIVTLQAAPGVISPADQASLDAIQAHSQTVATQLAALDTSAAPVVPVVPVVPPVPGA